MFGTGQTIDMTDKAKHNAFGGITKGNHAYKKSYYFHYCIRIKSLLKSFAVTYLLKLINK